MKTLFNDGWQFAELGITNESMYKDGKPVLFNPEQFLSKWYLSPYPVNKTILSQDNVI